MRARRGVRFCAPVPPLRRRRRRGRRGERRCTDSALPAALRACMERSFPASSRRPAATGIATHRSMLRGTALRCSGGVRFAAPVGVRASLDRLRRPRGRAAGRSDPTHRDDGGPALLSRLRRTRKRESGAIRPPRRGDAIPARKAHALRRCTTTAERRHAAGAGGRSRRRRRSSPAAAGGTGRNGTSPAHTARRSLPRPRRGCRRTDAVHPRPAGRAHRFAGPCAPPCRRTAATRRGRISAPARAR